MKLKYRDPQIEALHDEINHDLELINEVLNKGEEKVAKVMLIHIMENLLRMRMRSTMLRAQALDSKNLTTALRANAARATTDGCIELVDELCNSSGLGAAMGITIESMMYNVAQA